MNVTIDLVVTVERVRICREVTDVNADKDTLEDIVKPVSHNVFGHVTLTQRSVAGYSEKKMGKC